VTRALETPRRSASRARLLTLPDASKSRH
jgi:hypothetical protein